MKTIITANGQKKIKLSKNEWEIIGRKAGWMKKANINGQNEDKNPIYSLPAELESKFGGLVHSNERIGDFTWEKRDETMGTAYITVTYRQPEDVIYLDKVYESETMDENFGENLKLNQVSQNYNSLKEKLFAKLNGWLQ